MQHAPRELAELTQSPPPGIVSVEANENNMYQWDVMIAGADTPYEGGKFSLLFEFPIDYPFKGPSVHFKNKLYHPNVDDDGAMCISLLKSDAWKPTTKATTIITSVLQLLQEPHPDDALVASIAEQYLNDRDQYNKTAREYTSKYAASS
ncbi:ubiquitin conjugating enzyme [Malassezia pachydermatis]|uniref:E2 ubiquitin-conjugating enzyme n=1 Tax=Malassezia pachydermatis TaxID=77020 RepID=A0A0M9VMS4_9BASI|nr:ubiquitin conjugating enzyme [Malassezia pachydermatis]KOS12593.1 ubiquitin conjugating enzyme [Malassezia pachydermatis]